MLTALRTYWRMQALRMRDACGEAYRHYRLANAAHRPLVPRSHGDEVRLAALDRAHEEQHHQAIERQVRRYYEASRFVTKEQK